jgi:uncharacterized protein YcbX
MKVTRLSTTPIKGLGLNHPDAIEISQIGAVGDREFFIIDENDQFIKLLM